MTRKIRRKKDKSRIKKSIYFDERCEEELFLWCFWLNSVKFNFRFDVEVGGSYVVPISFVNRFSSSIGINLKPKIENVSEEISSLDEIAAERTFFKANWTWS